MREHPVRGRILRAARGLRTLSAREVLTALHVVVVMAAVEVTVRWVPLPRLSRALGVPLQLEPTAPEDDREPLEEFDVRTGRRLACAWRVAALWPFSDGPCLRRSLAGGHLIRSKHPVLRLGVMEGGTDVVAHAWLEIEGRPLEPIGHLLPFQQASNRIEE